MPFNGSGTFVSLGAPKFPAVAGELILADRFNDNMNDIFAQGLTKCITRDGQSPPTANIPMAGFKMTGLGDATAATDAVNLGQSFAKRGLVGAVDWDTRTTYGMYEVTAAALAGPASNFPSTSEIGQLLVYNQGANIVHAYVIDADVFLRRRVSGVWTSWVSIRTGAKEEAVALASPPGMVATFAMDSAPTGWLKCNGAAVSRTTFADLFAAIGTVFGVGDGSTTFNVPEMRGEFPRGWDDARGVDTGRVFGSAQTDLTESHTHTASSGTQSVSHTHTFSDTSSSSGSHEHQLKGTAGPDGPLTSNGITGGSGATQGFADFGVLAADGAHTHTVSGTTGTDSVSHTHAITVNATGGTETRPRNIALLYCIKT